MSGLADVFQQPPNERDAMLRDYPGLRGYGFEVSRGDGPGYAEFYPPWESHNPQPGTPLIEIRDQNISGAGLTDMLAGDAMHYLGAVDPRSGAPINQNVRAIKEQFGQSLTPEQHAINRRAYDDSGDDRPYDEWMDQSRLDAYLRGTAVGQWPESFFTPEQRGLGQLLRWHLRRP